MYPSPTNQIHSTCVATSSSSPEDECLTIPHDPGTKEVSPGPLSSGRRGFLRAAGAAAFGAGAFWAASANRAEAAVGTTANGGTVHSGTVISGIYDVSSSPYNAKGDGVTNDAPAIQAAINAASASDGYDGGNAFGGGIVYLPAGNYYLGSPLTITKQIIMVGAGWGNPYPNDGGTMLIVPNISAMTSSPAITVSNLGRGTTLRDFAIFHIQPAGGASFTPTSFPAAISVTTSDVSLENLLLVNPTIGISIATGRVNINKVWGQPLTIGINIDNAEDVVKLNNVHFWPFWNQSSGVMGWTQANGVAIASYRNDSPQMSNLFAINYNKMFHFSASSYGNTTTCFVTNANSDGCTYGMYIDCDAVTGTFSNCGFNQVSVYANNVTLQFSCVHFAVAQGSLVYIASNTSETVDSRSQNNVIITNAFFQNWNLANTGSVAIEAHGLSTIYLGGGTVFKSSTKLGDQVYPVSNQQPTVYYGSFTGGTIDLGS